MKRQTATYLIGTIVFLLLFSFCNKPNEVLSKKSMERLMYDIYIAEALIDNDYASYNTPEKKEALINEVFKKHRVSQAQWDTSLSWYSDKVEIYLKMNDSVRARLKRQQTKIDELLAKENSMIQSVTDRSILTSNIPRHYSFSEVNPKNGFRFRLDSTQIADQIAGNIFQFSFEALAVPTKISELLTATLMLEYKDTTIYQSDTITQNRKYVIDATKHIAGDTLRSIIGHVHLQDMLNSYRGIQLNNIFLGSIGSDSIQENQTDSTRNELLPDSIANSPNDTVQKVLKDSIIERKPERESIRKMRELEIQADE